MASAEVGSVIHDLFAIAGVTRVVSIDDMNALPTPVEDALALTQRLSTEEIKTIFADFPAVTAIDDLDIRLREIRRLWEQVQDDTRRFLLNRLRSQVAQAQAVDASKPSTELVDENTFLELSTLFSKYGLQLLSLKLWQENQGEIISNAMPPTLFLVDEDFSKEEGGTRFSGIALIKTIMDAAPADRVLCALLTHNPRYQSETLHEAWKELCRKEGLNPSRFVLIPKKLVQNDPIGFARLVKLALLNRKVDELKNTARGILRSAQDNAHTRLDDIDIYDFDQIVFRSSWREGIWEPDTLFRVFGLFHHDETRKLAKKDENLYSLADAIRTLSLVPTKSDTAPNYNTITLQRLELYESGQYLNSHFTPIDVGDIFQKTGESNKQYILLAQSCDLMVRTDGKRNPFINEALLAEIVAGPIKDRDGHGELQFLDEYDKVQYFVSFKRTHSVKLAILDICALNEKGEAVFVLDSPCPDRVIPSWKRHYEKLTNEFQKVLKHTEELIKKGVSPNTAAALVARSSNSTLFSPTFDIAKKTILFNVKRVGRLKQPRAAGLLSRFATFIARQAFDHDFGDYEDIEEPTEAKDIERIEPTKPAPANSPPTQSVAENSVPEAAAPQPSAKESGRT